MANRVHHGSPAGGDLFSGLKFMLSHQVPMRSYYIRKLRERGAIIVGQEAQADLCIVDDIRKPPASGFTYHSYKFIVDSLHENGLQDYKHYVVGLHTAADRPVGSATVASKSTRNPFTKADDQLLYNWIEPYRRLGGSWKGNEIYKQLARQHPHHTFQSWRTRFLSVVSKNPNLTVTEVIDHYTEPDDQIATPPPERSPKRCRLDSPHSVAVHAHHESSTNGFVPVDLHENRQAQSTPFIVTKESTTSVQRNGDVRLTIRDTEGAEIRSDNPIQNSQRDGPASPAPLPDLRTLENQTVKPDSVREKEIKASSGGLAEDDSWDDKDSDSNSVEHTQTWFQRQSCRPSQSFKNALASRKFTRKDVQQLYKAVPDIQSINLEDQARCWENVADSRSGHHSAREWRLFYETMIVPEYMRRNSLDTREDLDAHIDDIRRREKPDIKEEAMSEHATESGSPGRMQIHVQQDNADDESSNMFFEDGSEASPSPNQSRRTALNDQKVSPSSEDAANTMVIEIRETTHAPLSPQAASTRQPLFLSEHPVSQTSPKKRLFGRSLNAELLSSQREDSNVLAASIPPNSQSFGTGSATSAVTSSNSIALPESKRPPESAQRPPKSVTTSQEEDIALKADKEPQEDTRGSLDTGTDIYHTLQTTDDPVSSSRDSSPTLNLISDPMADEDAGGRSSPVLSDTGSEYMAFETAPERSQLWDPDEDATQGSLHSEEDSDESQTEHFRIVQHLHRDTPKKGVQMKLTHQSITSPASTRSSVEQHGIAEEQLEDKSMSEMEGSPELDVQIIPVHRAVPRTETQALFQQSMPQVEDDATLFNLPSPEGGWEQFGDLEDDMDDIRTSVELVDDNALKRRRLSSSETDEDVVESVHLGGSSKILPQLKEYQYISSEASDHTTLSEDDHIPALSTQQQLTGQLQASRVANRSSSSQTPSHSMTEDTTSDEESPNAAVEGAAIRSWLNEQTSKYSRIGQSNSTRLASTALQATVLNLSAATFTLRDMVAAFELSEAKRKSQFEKTNRLKREHTDSTPPPQFKPKTNLTEEEAKTFLPQDVLGVWTIEDDEDFISKTTDRIKRVERKHGAAGVKRRMSFLRLRYGEGGPISGSPLTPAKRRR